MIKKIYPLFIGSLLITTIIACNRQPVEPEQKIPYNSLTQTTDYFKTFQDESNITTVHIDNAVLLKDMFKEMDSYIRLGTSEELNYTQIKDMFNNDNKPFSSATLDSAVNLDIAKYTAQSFGSERLSVLNTFDTYFSNVANASKSYTKTATVGQAGVIDGILVDEKGFEYVQFIQKGLIGAFLFDQIVNVYLGDEAQSADNTKILDGHNYTQLAHNWDQAYGLLTNNAYFPMPDEANPGKFLESFLGGYARQVDKDGVIYMAFLKGRAAIVNNDVATRRAQIEIIRTQLENAIATVAISYLNKTMTATSDRARFHALSEATGFIYGLRFAHNPKVSKVLSEELIDKLTQKTNGFWDLTTADITYVRDQIADKTGIDKTIVVSH